MLVILQNFQLWPQDHDRFFFLLHVAMFGSAIHPAMAGDRDRRFRNMFRVDTAVLLDSRFGTPPHLKADSSVEWRSLLGEKCILPWRR